MSRTFAAASTEKITLGLGAMASKAFGGATQVRTVGCIFRCTSFAASRVLFSAGASNTVGYRLTLSTAGKLVLVLNGNSSTPATALSTNTWYCVLATKDTGSVAPRYHYYDYLTRTWTHENGATSIANSSAPLTRAAIGVSQDGTTSPFEGQILAAGVWQELWTDAACERLDVHRGALWFMDVANARPSGVWLLNQDVVTQLVPDESGGGAGETARTGTSVATVSDPFSYGLGAMMAA